jgi:signal transduction histidine kinase
LWTAALTAESLLDDVGADSPLHHRADRLRQLTRGALAEMRSLLLELRPAELVEVSLDGLIGHLLDALECRRTLDVSVQLDPVSLEPTVHLACYRIAQEGLRNVARHANASALQVRLCEGPPVELSIVDDGAGFDPDDVPAGHLGLTIMRERAAAIGAQLLIDAAPGRGTRLRLRIEQ